MSLLKGKQFALGSDGIAQANLDTTLFTADAAGRALFATDYFDAATFSAKFGSSSVSLDRLAEPVLQIDGGQAATADLPAGGFKLTSVADGTAATDAVNKGQVDAAAVSLSWKLPVAVKELVGNASIATINGLGPTAGDAYVATDGGTPTAGTSDAVTAGDLIEYDGASWLVVVQAVGGFPPDGTRVLLATQTALIAPYTDATDDGSIHDFDGTTLTSVDTAESADGAAVFISGEQSIFENQAYTFDGAVPTGSWVQFSNVSPTFAIAVALGAANDAGSGTDTARSNHVHSRDTSTQETLTAEAITGTDTAIGDTLAAVPLSDDHFKLTLNGQLMEEGAGNAYTRSSQTITWLASSGDAPDLEASDELIATYTVQGA